MTSPRTQNVVTTQISVSTITTVVSARTGRLALYLIMNDSVADVYLGLSTVLTSTGLLLQGVKGTTLIFTNFEGALSGITSGSTATVTVMEIY